MDSRPWQRVPSASRVRAVSWRRYYGVPSVSWRDAAFHLMIAGEPGFRHEDVYYDRGHPNAHVGHRSGLRPAED